MSGQCTTQATAPARGRVGRPPAARQATCLAAGRLAAGGPRWWEAHSSRPRAQAQAAAGCRLARAEAGGGTPRRGGQMVVRTVGASGGRRVQNK